MVGPRHLSVCLHGVSDSRDVTFCWKPGKHILYQLDHRGVGLAVEITEKQPVTCLRREDRQLPLKHPESGGGGIYCRWDLLLVPICKGITHFFIIALFILFPNSFLIHLEENKNIEPSAHTLSERADNDGGSSCE